MCQALFLIFYKQTHLIVITTNDVGTSINLIYRWRNWATERLSILLENY